MHTLDIKEAMHARRVFRFMSLGVMPSQENAMRAQAVLTEYAELPDVEVRPVTAIRVARAIGIGVAPSEENCQLAEAETLAIIDAIRQTDSSSLRATARERG